MTLSWDDPDLKFLLERLRLGKVALFAGAGFSAAAHNRNGDSLPLGKDLAKFLAEKSGDTYADEPLPIVYEAAQLRLGTKELWRLLAQLYRVDQYPPWYATVAKVVWHRIYTTNIDDLLQLLFREHSNQELSTFVHTSDIEERDQLLAGVQCIHLLDFLCRFHHHRKSSRPRFVTAG